MIQVTRERFYKFLNENPHEVIEGLWMHSNFYICKKTGNKIAYMETSSYGAPPVYKIESDVHEDNYSVNEKLK